LTSDGAWTSLILRAVLGSDDSADVFAEMAGFKSLIVIKMVTYCVISEQ